jgi:hypothetical protein
MKLRESGELVAGVADPCDMSSETLSTVLKYCNQLRPSLATSTHPCFNHSRVSARIERRCIMCVDTSRVWYGMINKKMKAE